MQVLEDLEALVQLLSSRGAEAEHNVSHLQTQVTSLQAAASQSSKGQEACNKQIDTLKKEAVVTKRVLLRTSKWRCTDIDSAPDYMGERLAFLIHACSSGKTLPCACAQFQASQAHVHTARSHHNMPMHTQAALQELTTAKAELSSAKSEGTKHKEQCSDLQSQNAALSSDLRHTQQSLTAAQVMLRIIVCPQPLSSP